MKIVIVKQKRKGVSYDIVVMPNNILNAQIKSIRYSVINTTNKPLFIRYEK